MSRHKLLEKYDVADPECGFDLPPGWESLVDKLMADLISLGWDKDLGQVKEKFGGLRFYIGAADTDIHMRISEAENESFKICPACGSTDQVSRVQSSSYIEYACQKCKETYGVY